MNRWSRRIAPLCCLVLGVGFGARLIHASPVGGGVSGSWLPEPISTESFPSRYATIDTTASPPEGITRDSSAAPSNNLGGPRGGPIDGACCFGEPICAIIPEPDCLIEGLRWLGPGTTCDQCPQMPECSSDSVFAQSPGNPFEFETLGVSEASRGLKRYENISQVVGPITSVTFYGFDLAPTPNGDFVECVEFDNTFEISFHPDRGNRPAPAACTYTLTATRTPTGIYYIQGLELNVYEVTLPTPCIMTRGWVSIVGQGDPDCWFLWHSPPEQSGDDFSICDGCISDVQGNDFAVCLHGTFGGATGSCCNDSTGACANDVAIQNCIGLAERFTPDIDCDELSPPCGKPVGACCDSMMSRGLVSCADGVAEEDCQEPGMRWEVNGVCAFLEPECGEAIGACCIGAVQCLITTQDVCSSEGWNWIGPDTTCFQCPMIPACPPSSLFSQPQADPSTEPSAYTSESARGITVYDDFTGVAGTIESVRFWGVDLQPIGIASWIECEELIPDFEISFYVDEGNAPGELVSSQFVTALRTPLNVVYLGAELNMYEATLNTPVAMPRGWISIVGHGSPTCYFLWSQTPASANGSVREIREYRQPLRESISFAFCLIGTAGGVTGACCHQPSGACSNGVAIENCLAANQQFSANGTCAADLSDCGVPRGACCLPQFACEFTSSQACASLGGNFIGVNQPCLACPCRVECGPDAISENEPGCTDGFVDTTNYGCDGPNPIFTPLVLNELYCGTTGVYFDGENFGADTDWYQLIVDEPTPITYEFESETPATLRVFGGGEGCPGILTDGFAVSPCEPAILSTIVGPGPVWIQIEPQGPSDASACPARYRLQPLNVPCNADFDFDRDVDMLDFSVFQTQFGLIGAGLFGDLNLDDMVDLADAHLFEDELGVICP